MESIDAFSLEQHKEPYEKWPRRTRLFFEGQDVGTAISGFVIEGQYQCIEGYLLIASEDCPFEEANHFILLNPSFQPIAQKVLFAPYQTFLLYAHWAIAPNALRLHYYDGLFYTLSLRKPEGFLRRKFRLQLEQFCEPENDAEANASILDLEQRLKRVAERLNKDDAL
jgi:hypothetical protein